MSRFDTSYLLIRDGEIGEFYWRGKNGKSDIVRDPDSQLWTLMVKDGSAYATLMVSSNNFYFCQSRQTRLIL